MLAVEKLVAYGCQGESCAHEEPLTLSALHASVWYGFFDAEPVNLSEAPSVRDLLSSLL